MHQIIVEYEGELRTKAKHLQSGNEIITDAPVDNHGKGEAFSPTDLVATALASCVLTIMGIVAERRDIDLKGTTSEVTKVMGENPRRIAEIHVDIHFKFDISNQDRKVLEKAAHSCPVHQSLHGEFVKKKIVFNYPS